MFYRHILIFIFVFTSTILQAQEDSDEIGADPQVKNSKVVGISGDRYGLFNLRKKNGPAYISLYPGLTYGFSEMLIKSRLGKADMAADLGLAQNVDYLFDLKSIDFQISENFGFTILGRTKCTAPTKIFNKFYIGHDFF